ncbi:hypothetical protein [Nonomuraea helvata]|uniref:Uncharacterized protein n=1 Tax=Nonomuraea helvata TaxID=37484 RepID=A0ABV5S3E7_9ACTN
MATAALDTIWFTRCPVPTATGIAADQGWPAGEFAADGIEVRSLQDDDPGVPRETHYTHALTGLFREGGNVPALWARSRGEATRLIGLTWIEERQAILVRPGTALEHPVQLKGLRLAVPRRRIAIDFWRAMALRGFHGAPGLAGLGLGDAETVDVDADHDHPSRLLPPEQHLVGGPPPRPAARRGVGGPELPGPGRTGRSHQGAAVRPQ